MNKKLLLLGIGIVAVLAVSCRAKNTDKEVINTDNTNNEVESQAPTSDSKTDSENANVEEKVEVPNTEGDDTKNSEENNDSEEERNLNYKDVDIKVPSIHED